MRLLAKLPWARFRAHPASWLLVIIGIATATLMPIASAGAQSIVATLALRKAIADLDPAARSVAVLGAGLGESASQIRQRDRRARAGLARLTNAPIGRQMLTKEISDGQGGRYYFGAAEDLSRRVRVIDGRLPQSCTPLRCEVVTLGPGSVRPPTETGLVVVGRVVRTDPLLLGGAFDPGPAAVILLTDGVEAAARLDYLSAFQRTYSWVAAIDVERVSSIGVEAYLRDSAAASDQVYLDRMSLIAPDELLRAQARRTERSTRRLGVLASTTTVLLLGFAATAALALRREHVATIALIRKRGASRRQRLGLTLITAAAPVLAGLLAGVPIGAGVVAALAIASSVPAISAVKAALLAGTALAAVGATIAVVVVSGALSMTPTGRTATRTIWRVVDATIFFGAAAALLTAARGAVSVDALNGQTDPVVLSLPAITICAGSLLVARGWLPLVSTVARVLPRQWLAARIGLLGAVRQPLRPTVATAFLAAATATTVFAGAYQATLHQGAQDQSTYAVPLDATVQTGASLRSPLEVTDATTLTGLAGGAGAYSVIRTAAAVRISASESLTPALLGLDPRALPKIPGWDRVVGAGSGAWASATLADTPAGALGSGIAIPAGSTELTFPATGDLDLVDISVWLRTPDGRDIGLSLSQPATAIGAQSITDSRLWTKLPDHLPEGARIFAFTMVENSFAATRHQHRAGEGGSQPPALTGRLQLRAPVGIPADQPWSGWSADGAGVTGDGALLRVEYTLTGTKVVIRAGTATTPPLPVLTDPVTAGLASDGLLQLGVGGAQPIPARVVGVIPRFPTTAGPVVITTAAALADELDLRDPGTGSVHEIWLSSAGDLDSALRSPPFNELSVDVRSRRLAALLTDPLATGAERTLMVGAVLALLLAVVSLVMLVLAERRDEDAQFYAWEADGTAPSTLRAALFARSVFVVVVGVTGGVGLGLALTRITSAMVALTAVGTNPVPPLIAATGLGWSSAMIGLGLSLGLGTGAVAAVAALREPLPRRPEGGTQ